MVEEEAVDEEVVEESDIGEEEGPSSKGLLIFIIFNLNYLFKKLNVDREQSQITENMCKSTNKNKRIKW